MQSEKVRTQLHEKEKLQEDKRRRNAVGFRHKLPYLRLVRLKTSFFGMNSPSPIQKLAD
jgi:hypothetical protein